MEKDYSSCLKYSCFQLSTSTRTISATCSSFIYIKMSRMTKLIILKSIIFSICVYQIRLLMRPRHCFETAVRSAARAIHLPAVTDRKEHLEASRYKPNLRVQSIPSVSNPTTLQFASGLRPPSPATFARPPRRRRRSTTSGVHIY